MDRAKDIKELFEAVYESQKNTFGVKEKSIKVANGTMGHAYKPNPRWEKDTSNTLCYEDPGLRCAYLLKYAMLHTAMVYDLLQQASMTYSVKKTIEAKQTLKLCSLGSGPGTDIVAMLFFLQDHFDLKPCQASLLDQSIEWKGVFDSVVSQLKTKRYKVNKMVPRDYFSFNYLRADLLNFSNEKNVVETVRSADIITMVKFISAAARKDTRKMLKNIFETMKPGALLFFIDNAAGGFYEMVEECANHCRLKTLFGPLKHYKYEEPNFKIVTLDIPSQYKTIVTAVMWIKEESAAQNMTNQSRECIKVHPSGNVGDNSYKDDEWDETDFPRAQSGVTNKSFSRDNQGFTNTFQYYSDRICIQQRNIRLHDSLYTKKEDPPMCCIIM